MQLLDLPREVFDEILVRAILARGLKRGLRLRLVSKFFSDAVMDAIYNYHLLDTLYGDLLEGAEEGKHEFMIEYLVRRLISPKPTEHIPYLNCIRTVAEEIYKLNEGIDEPQPPARDMLIRKLCTAAVTSPDRTRPINFCNIYGRDGILTEEYEKARFAAAIITNARPIIEEIMENRPARRLSDWSTFHLFGSCLYLAGTYGTTDTIEYMLTNGLLDSDEKDKQLADLFFYAVKSGRVDMVRFIYTFHEKNHDSSWYSQYCRHIWIDSLPTSSVEVLEFFVGLLDIDEQDIEYALYALARSSYYGTEPLVLQRLMELKLSLSAEKRHERKDKERNEKDEYDKYKWEITLSVLAQKACESGNKDILECLMTEESFPERAKRKAVGFAVRGGHPGLARDLLRMGFEPPRYLLPDMLRHGDVDMIRRLLDAGTMPSSSDEDHVGPLLWAVHLEHKALFELLLERGACLDGKAETCYRYAKEEGLESMLQLLQEHGVDMEKCEAARQKHYEVWKTLYLIFGGVFVVPTTST